MLRNLLSDMKPPIHLISLENVISAYFKQKISNIFKRNFYILMNIHAILTQTLYRAYEIISYNYRSFRTFDDTGWYQLFNFIQFIVVLLIAFMAKPSLKNIGSNMFCTSLKFKNNLSNMSLYIFEKIRKCPGIFRHIV